MDRDVQTSEQELATQLVQLARVLLAPGTVSQTLERIVTLAVASIESCDEAALCGNPMLGNDPVIASPLATHLDELQRVLDEGPCIDVLHGAESVYVDDFAVDERWPRFAREAVLSGVHSALAYRLSDGAETLGALQLFASRPLAFDLAQRIQGLLFAALAGMAIGVADEHASQVDRSTNLEAALTSREVIGQAQGILMERERITADQAFEQLRHSSQQLNVKLRDIAQELVDTGTVALDDSF